MATRRHTDGSRTPTNQSETSRRPADQWEPGWQVEARPDCDGGWPQPWHQKTASWWLAGQREAPATLLSPLNTFIYHRSPLTEDWLRTGNNNWNLPTTSHQKYLFWLCQINRTQKIPVLSSTQLSKDVVSFYYLLSKRRWLSNVQWFSCVKYLSFLIIIRLSGPHWSSLACCAVLDHQPGLSPTVLWRQRGEEREHSTVKRLPELVGWILLTSLLMSLLANIGPPTLRNIPVFHSIKLEIFLRVMLRSDK